MGFEDIQPLPLHSWPLPTCACMQVVVTVHEGHELLQIHWLLEEKTQTSLFDIQRGKRLLADSFCIKIRDCGSLEGILC